MRCGQSPSGQYLNYMSLQENIDHLYHMVEELVNTNQAREGREELFGPPEVLAAHDPEPPVLDQGYHRRFMRLNPPIFTSTNNFIEAAG